MTHFILAVIGYLAIGTGYTYGFLANKADFAEYVNEMIQDFMRQQPDVATESKEFYTKLTYIVAIPFWPFFLFSSK